MTPAELYELGCQLGEGWQSKLARAMPCSTRTVRYWLADDRAIRPLVAARIREVIKTLLRKKS